MCPGNWGKPTQGQQELKVLNIAAREVREGALYKAWWAQMLRWRVLMGHGGLLVAEPLGGMP